MVLTIKLPPAYMNDCLLWQHIGSLRYLGLFPKFQVDEVLFGSFMFDTENVSFQSLIKYCITCMGKLCFSAVFV